MALKSLEELGPRGREKRGQILGAARRLFLERGFERTSMEAIREEAGVSKPTLYNHYQGKEALFAAVLGEIVEEIAGDWLPAAEADEVPLNSCRELEETLAEFAHAAIAGLMRPEYLALIRVVVAETPRFPQLGEIFLSAGPKRGMKTVCELLENAAERGLVEVTDVNAAARAFLGPILLYVLMDGLLRAGEPRRPAPEHIEEIVTLFMRAIERRERRFGDG